MAKILLLGWIAFQFLQSLPAHSRPLRFIDMHLQALHADAQGPPPISIGAPFRDLGINDRQNEYRETFMKALKSQAWADKVITSPTSDDSLKNMTLAAFKCLNVYAVTSGDPELVRDWKAAEPCRIINSLDWNFGLASKYGLTPVSLEKLFQSGESRYLERSPFSMKAMPQATLP